MMGNKAIVEKIQTLSLRWKWGIYLFLAFLVLSSLALSFYRQAAFSSYAKIHQAEHQDRFQSLILAFENEGQVIDVKTLPANKRTTLTNLLDQYATENVIIRLLDAKQELVYQTQNFDDPILASSSQLSQQTLDQNEYLVGSSRLVASQDNQFLGNLQYIVDLKGLSAYRQILDQTYNWGLLALIVLSLACSLALSYFFLKPLTDVNTTLDALEGDNLSRLRVFRRRTNDEWSDLSLHVNKLLDKVDRYVQGQKQFVEDVSHELRTPVAIVEGHLKMLNRWGKSDPTVLEESIETSLQEITRMKELVQEMLDLSRADYVDEDFKDEVTEINSNVYRVYQNFQMLYPDFQFYIDAERDVQVYVNIYHNHLEQIMIILLDNAVKYSTDRKEIHISVSQGMGRVEISVQDFGEGMSDADKERVFGRFYRVDKARSRAKGGNGLGLSIAKQLVEGYHGKIRVESVLNRGSIFYFEFPILSDPEQIENYQSLEI